MSLSMKHPGTHKHYVETGVSPYQLRVSVFPQSVKNLAIKEAIRLNAKERYLWRSIPMFYPNNLSLLPGQYITFREDMRRPSCRAWAINCPRAKNRASWGGEASSTSSSRFLMRFIRMFSPEEAAAFCLSNDPECGRGIPSSAAVAFI